MVIGSRKSTSESFPNNIGYPSEEHWKSGIHADIQSPTHTSLADTLYTISDLSKRPLLTKNAETASSLAKADLLTPTRTPIHFLHYLLKLTAPWSIGGILFMLIGIGLGDVVLKYKVYICPGGAICPGSINPNNEVLQGIRTFMQYWLQVGTIISGIGLGKLVAYQAWLNMHLRGSTIEALDMNLRALTGSAIDAVQLSLLKKGSRSFGAFMLTHIGITTAISLVVGRSISTLTDTGRVKLQFNYPLNISTPGHGNEEDSLFWNGIYQWLDQRLLDNEELNDQSNDSFSGTLIIRDNRTAYAINPEPSGPRIGSAIFCDDPSAHISIQVNTKDPDSNRTWYDILYWTFDPKYNWTIGADSIEPLKVTTMDNNADTFVWASNQEGVVPNAIMTQDRQMYVGLCKHTIFISQNQTASGGIDTQPIYTTVPNPTEFFTSRFRSNDCDESCLAWITDYALKGWWGIGDGTTMIQQPIFCKGGALAPFGNVDVNQGCRVSNETWSTTVRQLFDAYVQTAQRTGNGTQELWVRAESIDRGRWWLQALIPCCTLLLYVSCLTYTVSIRRVQDAFTTLDIFEVVVAASRAEHLPYLARNGELKRSTKIGGY